MNSKSILGKAIFFSSVTILATWLIQPAIAACSMIHTVGSNYDELDDWKVTTRIIPVKLKGVQTTVHKGTFSQSVIRHTEAGQYIVAIASPGHERLFKSIIHTCSDSQSQRRYSHTLNVKSGKLVKANIRLPFTSKKQKISLRVKNGKAYAFGDIALGPLDELLRHNASESPKSYYKGLPQFAGRAPKSPQFSGSNPNQIAGLQTKRQPLAWVNDPSMLWPNGVLRYDFDPTATFNGKQKDFIRSELREIESVTNVRFIENTPSPHDQFASPEKQNFVRIVEGTDPSACGSSSIGMQGRMQQLELKKSCIKPGDRTVKHEFLHALGVYHEHNRPDRYLHVDFHEKHLKHLDKADNFNQKTLAHTHGDYDASSIMHYPSNAFAKFGKNTLTCKSGCKTEEMGGNELSRTDILGLLKMYPGFLNHLGGLEWGPRISTIDIAIGDITGDGQAEIITVRNADKEGLARIQIVESWNDWKNLRGKYDDGRGWGDGAIGLSVSVGNIDDDPELEFAVSRRQSVNMRAALYDYINDDPNLEPNRGEVKVAQTFGENWPKNLHIRQVLFKDLDADQRDELILVTNAASLPSERTSEPATVSPLLVMKRNPASRKFEQVFNINGQLLPGTKVTRVSLGDTNRNGKLEFLVTTDAKKTGTPRFAIFEMPDTPEIGKNKKLTKVFEGGHGWGDENYATDISVSNPTPVAGQWIHPWIAVSRRSFVNNRVSIYQFDPLSKDYIFKGKQGLKWGKNHYAHRVKFVDYDGDFDDDLIVIRGPRKNFNSEEDRLRFVENNSFRDPTLWREFGLGFYPLSNRQYITSLAIGDVDGNGSLELAVGNSAWDPLILSGGGGFGGKAPKPKTAASRRFGVLNLPDSP